MYLSRIWLDTDKRDTMLALASPHEMHAAVEGSFPGERKRKLWRLDRLGDRCGLLVLSEDRPALIGPVSRLVDTASAAAWETKDYEPFLATLENGQHWRFRLCANPVHSINGSKTDNERGRVLAHVTVEQQKNWLAECKAKAHGFSLDGLNFDVVQSQWHMFSKRNSNEKRVSIKIATFEGTLRIEDVEPFKAALVNGIGREKAYGCGLLTIARS